MAGWSEGLTKAQIAVASHAGTHARVLAGPGTGKTHTMARRVAWLTTDGDVSPDNIVVLTFTRAAASELRRKIQAELEGFDCDLPRVSTLHSFALRQVLRERGL